MVKLISPEQEYDLSYKKREAPATVGIVILCVYAYLLYSHQLTYSKQWMLYTFPVRFGCAYWAYKLSWEQNRDTFWNTFLGWLSPGITLIVLSQLKKKNLTFKIDTGYPPEKQLKELRAFADRYIKDNRYVEAAFIYEYIKENLPYSDADRDMIEKLSLAINSDAQ